MKASCQHANARRLALDIGSLLTRRLTTGRIDKIPAHIAQGGTLDQPLPGSRTVCSVWRTAAAKSPSDLASRSSGS
jgi:hypothetical protein